MVDLIHLIHIHPFLAKGPLAPVNVVQFNLVKFNVEFPRAGTYRVWVQFQRSGVVNTARFDVAVTRLE